MQIAGYVDEEGIWAGGTLSLAKVIGEIFDGTWAKRREEQRIESEKEAVEQAKAAKKDAVKKAKDAKKAAKHKAKKEIERQKLAAQGFTPYEKGGINFRTKENNTYGVDGSRRAARDAFGIEARETTGQALSLSGQAVSIGGAVVRNPAVENVGSVMSFSGNFLEKTAKNKLKNFLDPGYRP